VEGFDFHSGGSVDVHQVELLPDGSQLVEMTTVLDQIPDGLIVEVEIFVGGVMFEDGTVLKRLTAADFDEYGANTLRFIRGATVTTSVCHRIRLYQDGVLIGELF
jgi:hypothetical protein